jgi:hypothetical protein
MVEATVHHGHCSQGQNPSGGHCLMRPRTTGQKQSGVAQA